MARISFSALVEEITGKLAGSVFQDSYGGFQIRTRVTPRNPQSNFQQLRRGAFGFISQSWRTLTSIQRQTFIDAAVTAPAALNLFIQANVNLTLIEEPTITNYVPSTVPDQMIIEFDTATPSALLIKATGAITTVPANTKLLLQVTYQKEPTKIFTNPSQYSPIISFDEGTDLSSPAEILSAWQARYGVFSADKRLCLKSNLIDKTNGLRGPDSVSCTTSEEMAKFVKIFASAATVTRVPNGSTDEYVYNMPGNTLLQEGDSLTMNYQGEATGTGGTRSASVTIEGAGLGPLSLSIPALWSIYVTATRKGVGTLVVSCYATVATASIQFTATQITGLDFTAAIEIKVVLSAFTTGDISLYSGYINKELL